ncbi:MAG: glycosyltransferase family 4 protein [Candidatus Rokubacteria bacterium]|nr:glycosyltransferase family 4 protein [Candidatus Rokubacteria bacterium]
MARPRIALVCHNAIRRDGEGRGNYELAKHLARRGYGVHLLANRADPDLLNLPALRYEHIAVGVQRPTLLKYMIFREMATRQLARGGFDLVHLTGAVTRGAYDAMTCQFCHGGWRAIPATWRGERGARGAYHRLSTAVYARMERRACGQPGGALVAVSEKIRGEMRRFAGPGAKHVFVVHNGVDPAEFGGVRREEARERLAAELGLGRGDVVLLFAGDLRTERKGLRYLLEALGLLPPHVKLLVAGRERGSPFLRLGERPSFRGRVQFLGFRRDLPEILAASDLFVFPTLYDPCPTVVLEAMASGTPVVVSSPAYCGTSELIQDMHSGVLLTAPTDPGEIAAKIEILARDYQLRQEIGDNGRRAAAQHTWERVGEAYEEIFTRCGAPQGSRAAVCISGRTR